MVILMLYPSLASAGGWYLLSPPGTFDDSDPANPVFQIDDKVPMSRWKHVEAYDSAKECQRGRGEYIAAAGQVGKEMGKPGDGVWFHLVLRAQESRCVATDDPRLTPRPVDPPKGT